MSTKVILIPPASCARRLVSDMIDDGALTDRKCLEQFRTGNSRLTMDGMEEAKAAGKHLREEFTDGFELLLHSTSYQSIDTAFYFFVVAFSLSVNRAST